MLIPRQEYLQDLIDFQDKDLIKVVTGIRRCGKSTLLEQFKKHLLKTGVAKKQIIALSFDDLSIDKLQDYHVLHDYILNNILPNKMNYVFLDEVQNVPMFEKALASLHLRKNIDLYITGSNAYLLSGELATFLTGRYVQIKMLPLSFREYLLACDKNSSLEENYKKYITKGSFPGTLELETPEKINEYLSGLYSTIILKDVVTRRKIDNELMLNSVVSFLFDNIGNLCSTKKIADTLTSYGRKIAVNTVESYIVGLLDCFMFYKIGRYDVKGKRYLKTGDKYYAADVGLRHYLLGGKNLDWGHVLENIICLELIRRGYRLHIGKVGGAEVDFVATKGDILEYYQVALSVRDEATFAREIGPLQKIKDNNPKCILTLDQDPPSNNDGIRRLNALDWLSVP